MKNNYYFKIIVGSRLQATHAAFHVIGRKGLRGLLLRTVGVEIVFFVIIFFVVVIVVFVSNFVCFIVVVVVIIVCFIVVIIVVDIFIVDLILFLVSSVILRFDK